MKHAKRMVLVPEDVLNRYEQKQKLETAPIMTNMMHQDTEMSEILQNASMPDAEKQKLYNANMESYLSLRRQKDGQIPTVRIAPGTEQEPIEKARLSDADVVEHIPKSLRARATALLNRLKARPDVISWDESGQVSLDGKEISHSNISDLVSDALRSRRNFNPTGSREFFRALSKMNMPKDLVRNEERWKQIDTSPDPFSPQRASPSQYFQDLLKRREGGKQTEKRWHNY